MNWEIIDIVYSGNWFLTSYNATGFVQDYPRLGGGKFLSTFIALMEDKNCKYIYDAKEFDQLANFTSDRLLKDSKWRLSVYKKIDNYAKRYFNAGEKLRQLVFTDLSDKRLISEINKVLPLHHWHHSYSVLVNGPTIDAKNHLSNKIRQELQKEISQTENFNKHWSLLTIPTKMSLRQKKDYEIAKLASQVNKKSDQQIQNQLKKIHQKYCWLDYMYLGPPASLKKYKAELRAAIKNNININLLNQIKDLKKKQLDLINKLKLSQKAVSLIRLAQYVLWQKGYRKDIQFHGLYCYEPFLREIAKRKKVNDWQVLSFLFPWQIENYIKNNKPRVTELIKRKKFSCLIVKRNKITILIGQKAKKFAKSLKLKERQKNISETNGQCAFAGKARGRVKIIRVPADITKMKQGDILISQATSQDLLPAMKKASAIVTNLGGLICHAAILSRELKIPCVVGTGNATVIFKDGDLVEVDATNGLIIKLK